MEEAERKSAKTVNLIPGHLFNEGEGIQGGLWQKRTGWIEIKMVKIYVLNEAGSQS